MPNDKPPDLPASRVVTIRPGCISCHRCAGLCPEVFEVVDGGCLIRGDARVDAVTSDNLREAAALPPTALSSAGSYLDEAADACPVQVIIVAPNHVRPEA